MQKQKKLLKKEPKTRCGRTKRCQKEADQLDLTNLLSLEEISDSAVKEAGGGQATDWDLDKEMNVTYWEVKVEDGNKTNVKINAQTGEILETEQDD